MRPFPLWISESCIVRTLERGERPCTPVFFLLLCQCIKVEDGLPLGGLLLIALGGCSKRHGYASHLAKNYKCGRVNFRMGCGLWRSICL